MLNFNPLNSCSGEIRCAAKCVSLHMRGNAASAIAACAKGSFVRPSVSSSKLRRRVDLKSTDVGIIEWPLQRLGLHRSMKSAATARKCCVSNSSRCIRPLSSQTDVSAGKCCKMHERPLRRAAPQHWQVMVKVRKGPFV